ncbi:MAG: polymerase LigD, polymerase domain protein [Phycisphaerales bacterium]|nr:polymerase LigD, polymerase domain protein [Phycisphaerales bacterium]
MATAKSSKSPPSSIRAGKREVSVSNPGKILYPETGFTKGEAVQYYLAIAPVLLPHLKHRPLTLKRYPNGVDQPFFYEKMCPSHRPDWVATTRMTTTNREIDFCMVEDAATLVWVANLASLELHTLLSRAPDLDRPTFMVFDHDPGDGADMLDCIRVALRFRDMLEQLGLKSFAKTSGGKGLHLYVPLNTPVTFDETKVFSRAVAQVLEKEDAAHVTTNMRKDLRKGKVFVDWSQNDRHKTTVCVYSLRARTRPTVSTPVEWEELERAVKKKDASGLAFETADVLKRVKKKGDLFEPVLKVKQKLPRMG